MEIIYIWTQFLKEESLKFLGIDKKLDLSKMYTYHLKYMEHLRKRSRGVFKREGRSNSSTSGRVPVEQTSVEKGAGETAISKENRDCSEKPTSLADENHGVENSRHGEEASSSAVIPAEENKLIEGAVQKCCRNLKSVDLYSENNKSHFSKEKPGHSKESRYSRMHRPSMELKVGRKKQNINSQTNEEPPKDCDSNRGGEVKCSVFRTELVDTEKNSDTSSKFCKRQGGNQTRRTRFSSGSEHITANELCKTNMRSEVASSNDSTCARGKGSSRQRRYMGRSRNGPAEQEKETRQPQVKHRFKQDLDNRAILDLGLQTSVIQHLLEYNTRRRELLFERSLHTCNICFEDKLGVYCMKFDPCLHVFCSDCISNYFEVRIMEGTVLSIQCPEGSCVSEAQPSQVQALVSPEMYVKYDSILLSVVLDTQPDIMYCPRRMCQYPVFHEDRTDKLATCPECNYAFCVLCEKVYHGVASCVIVPAEKRKLMQEYFKASDEQKETMERKYGKQQLKNLVDTFHLEWSASWIKKYSKKCPHCNTSIEKADGCNKMQCWKCDTVFCWLCSMKLDKLKPYWHFNDPSSPCNNNLFQGALMAEDFDEEFDFEE